MVGRDDIVSPGQPRSAQGEPEVIVPRRVIPPGPGDLGPGHADGGIGYGVASRLRPAEVLGPLYPVAPVSGVQLRFGRYAADEERLRLKPDINCFGCENRAAIVLSRIDSGIATAGKSYPPPARGRPVLIIMLFTS